VAQAHATQLELHRAVRLLTQASSPTNFISPTVATAEVWARLTADIKYASPS
jgi:hypothetical protein